MLTRPLTTRTHQRFLHFVTLDRRQVSQGFCQCYLQKRSKVARHLCAFAAREELQTGHLLVLKVLARSGGEGEYTMGRFLVVSQGQGCSAPARGTVCRHNLNTMTWPSRPYEPPARLSESGRCSALADAKATRVVHLLNATQYAALLPNVSPTGALSRTSPPKKPGAAISWTSLDCCTFDCCALVHIPDKTRASLYLPRPLICTFIGYVKQRKGHPLVHRPTVRFNKVMNRFGP